MEIDINAVRQSLSQPIDQVRSEFGRDLRAFVEAARSESPEGLTYRNLLERVAMLAGLEAELSQMELGVKGGLSLKEITPEQVGVKPFKPRREKSGFVIGGKNDSELIRRLRTINGVAVSDLESLMRPGASCGIETSHEGFLGEGESLLERLAGDNDFVLARGLTHQEIAVPLKCAVAICDGDCDKFFSYQGRPYCVGAAAYAGGQPSPFRDKTGTSRDYMVKNLETFKEIEFSGLLPIMIERYGFYEGDTPYRLEPADILSVFDFLR